MSQAKFVAISLGIIVVMFLVGLLAANWTVNSLRVTESESVKIHALCVVGLVMGFTGGMGLAIVSMIYNLHR